MGTVFENLGHGLSAVIKNSGAADADPGHVRLQCADLKILVCNGLLEGLLLLAHTEVQLAVEDHLETEGAYTGLVAVTGSIEEGAGLLEVGGYSFNIGHGKKLSFVY